MTFHRPTAVGRRAMLVGLFATLAAVCSGVAQEVTLTDDPLVICGTFSSLDYDWKLERLTGVEIRIVPAECGYQASVQFAEGEGSDSTPSRLIVVDVVFGLEGWPLGVAQPEFVPDAEDLRFTIPPGSGYASSFYGVVFRDHLEGVFTFPDGQESSVWLTRMTRGAWFER